MSAWFMGKDATPMDWQSKRLLMGTGAVRGGPTIGFLSSKSGKSLRQPVGATQERAFDPIP